jgi:hypothetical protein
MSSDIPILPVRRRQAVARKIAERLFCNGFDQKAARLVMEPLGRSIREADIGGWSFSAAVQQIAKAMEEQAI